MSKYLVTGGAGFIGSHLVDRLIDEGNSVAVIDNLSSGNKENLNTKAIFYEADIRDSGIAAIFKKENPEIVFHLAARISVRESVADPEKDAQTNIIGSINIINNFLKVNGGKINDRNIKFIFSSTGGAIYGDADIIPTPETYREFPSSPYGIAKLSVEKYLNYYHKNFGMAYTALRYSNVYGPRQNSRGEAGVVAIFCGKMLGGIVPEITGDGRQTRDFIYVDDVVEANVLSARSGISGFYNIGTGNETDVNTIFDLLNASAVKNFNKKYVPGAAGEQKRSCLDCARAQKELGWNHKTGLNMGLARTWDWFLNRSKS